MVLKVIFVSNEGNTKRPSKKTLYSFSVLEERIEKHLQK